MYPEKQPLPAWNNPMITASLYVIINTCRCRSFPFPDRFYNDKNNAYHNQCNCNRNRMIKQFINLVIKEARRLSPPELQATIILSHISSVPTFPAHFLLCLETGTRFILTAVYLHRFCSKRPQLIPEQQQQPPESHQAGLQPQTVSKNPPIHSA